MFPTSQEICAEQQSRENARVDDWRTVITQGINDTDWLAPRANCTVSIPVLMKEAGVSLVRSELKEKGWATEVCVDTRDHSKTLTITIKK